MNSRQAFQSLHAVLMGAVLGLVAQPVLGQANEPLQTQVCNEPPPSPPVGDAAQITGQWLEAGDKLRTRGTGVAESPELNGWVVFERSRPFVFEAAEGMVRGSYSERVIQGTDQRCKCELRIHVEQGCVAKVQVHSFIHPGRIVADYRNDQPGGGIASQTASRSPDGSLFTFALKASVCAGRSSRWLLLNTDVDMLERVAALGMVAPGGQSSALQPLFVPMAP